MDSVRLFLLSLLAEARLLWISSDLLVLLYGLGDFLVITNYSTYFF